MRIAIVGSLDKSLSNFRGPLISRLIASGHEVIAIAPNISNFVRLDLESRGAVVVEITMNRTGLNPLRDVLYCFEIKKIFKTHQPGLVLTYTIKPNIWGGIAASSLRIPVAAMVTGLGYAFTGARKNSVKQKLVNLIAIRLYRYSTDRNFLVVFQNKDDEQDFITAGCLKDSSKSVFVAGSGVDLDHYQATELPDRPVFLMIARLLKNKGVHEYCEAAVIVKRKFPEAKFILAGYFEEGPDTITREALDNWISCGIEYVGELADVRPMLSRSSVYVLPSYREGTPRSVLEAMAMGRPVITTDAPGCRETVNHGRNGFLVPVGDVDAVAKRMSEFIENPKLRCTMGAESLRYATEKFDVNKVDVNLMNFLKIR